METITIELTNEKAQGLLEQLENLDIIKILNKTDTESRSSRFRGKLDDKAADALRDYVDKSRLEWEERFPTS